MSYRLKNRKCIIVTIYLFYFKQLFLVVLPLTGPAYLMIL